MTIPTEVIPNLIKCVEAFPFDKPHVVSMAEKMLLLDALAELLAVREAQSVPFTPEDITEIMAQEWSEWCSDTGHFPDDFEWRGGHGILSFEPSRWSLRVAERILKLSAPPAPAVPTPITFSENADADKCRAWAWEQVKKDVTTDSWTVGDSCNFYGFYCWGWDMRRQYNEQRPPAVPDGYKLVPAELTAENGAKASLIGEFTEVKFINCPECFGGSECESCDGSGRIKVEAPVSWTTIKAIWKKGIEHFDSLAAAPTPTNVAPCVHAEDALASVITAMLDDHKVEFCSSSWEFNDNSGYEWLEKIRAALPTKAVNDGND